MSHGPFDLCGEAKVLTEKAFQLKRCYHIRFLPNLAAVVGYILRWAFFTAHILSCPEKAQVFIHNTDNGSVPFSCSGKPL